MGLDVQGVFVCFLIPFVVAQKMNLFNLTFPFFAVVECDLAISRGGAIHF